MTGDQCSFNFVHPSLRCQALPSKQKHKIERTLVHRRTNMDDRRSKMDNSKIDRQLTFEILLYLNIFYFSFYAGLEGLFLIIKFYHVEELLYLNIFYFTFYAGIE